VKMQFAPRGKFTPS